MRQGVHVVGMTRAHMGEKSNVAAFLLAYGIGVMADQVFYIVLSWHVLALTGSDSLTGLVVSLGALPRSVLLVFGGAVADRDGFKRVAVIASMLRAVVLALAAILAESPLSLVVPWATSFAFGVFEAFYFPSAQSMVTVVSQDRSVVRVQSLLSGVQKTCLVIAPAVAGLMVGARSAAACYRLCCILAMVSLLLLSLVETHDSASRGADGAHASGADSLIRTVRGCVRDPTLRSFLVLIAVAECVSSGLTTTGYIVLATFRGWGGAQMGLVMSAYGIGGTLTSFLVALLGKHRCVRRSIGTSVALTGLCFALSAIDGPLGWTVAFTVLAGMGSGVASTLLVAAYIDRAQRYDVATALSVMNLASFGTVLISSYVCGLMSEAVSAPWAFAVFGLVLVVSGLVFLFLSGRADPLERRGGE